MQLTTRVSTYLPRVHASIWSCELPRAMEETGMPLAIVHTPSKASVLCKEGSVQTWICLRTLRSATYEGKPERVYVAAAFIVAVACDSPALSDTKLHLPFVPLAHHTRSNIHPKSMRLPLPPLPLIPRPR